MKKVFRLRYVCERKDKQTFTGSVVVSSRGEADKKVSQMLAINHKEGYSKYSRFRLYDMDNNEIKPF